MTKERAKELMDLSSFGEFPYAYVPYGSMNDQYPVKSNGITRQEHEYVVALWKTMPGYTCFANAVNRIAKGEA
jgi:hypothetical protein